MEPFLSVDHRTSFWFGLTSTTVEADAIEFNHYARSDSRGSRLHYSKKLSWLVLSFARSLGRMSLTIGNGLLRSK
jgi:hypothetical protein